MQRDFGTHGWQFKRTIDEVVVGLRCMAGEPMTEFTPPEEFGREFHKENVSWRRQPAHRERLRPIPIPRGCANIKKLVHCVTVVEIVDELVFDPVGTGSCHHTEGAVVVRYERQHHEQYATFSLTEAPVARVCSECGGDGYSHLTERPRFPCLGCDGSRLRASEKAAFLCASAGLILDIDAKWPALPDLREDEHNRDTESREIREWWNRMSRST